MLYGWIIAMAGTVLVTLALAEVASACPNIGGEFQRVSSAAGPASSQPVREEFQRSVLLSLTGFKSKSSMLPVAAVLQQVQEGM